ncbi:L,D-transpeptidase [Pseudomonas azerbaijanoccidens]|uniref:L,D-transpeptidase n=1 Tax=Pseudomonas azerbaijanoccidentalis TaxID=2842347 RepID=UPI00200A7DB8|nr:L,D-transpeptidase [Pseudomonas azerbaijanoccidentalis]MCK8663764.1 L,D-transpeptidase [Pseudomonas azerbaijanoccidentalis]
MNLTIQVYLPSDRTKTGTLTLIDPLTGLALFGPVPVLGRAARNTAKAKGNASANSLLPFGDTPTGTYGISSIVANGTGTTRPINVYGQSGSIVLAPETGDALKAKEKGRVGLLIHAGRHAYSSIVGPESLKPTNGCIRMLDWDLGQLVEVIKSQTLVFPGKVSVEVGGPAGPQGDIDESIIDSDPPPTGGGMILP